MPASAGIYKSMPKNKRPTPRKSSTPPEEKEEVLSQALCALALELAEQEDGETLGAELRDKEQDFARLLRRYLNQQKDEILYGAIEQARYEDVGAYQLLRSAIEEAAGTVQLRREGAPALEIDAFAIPVFARSQGGLKLEECFQDDAAYDALLQSLREGGLESPQAKLVLVRHAYDLGEAERISYGQLNAMVREAAASLTEKKMSEAPALQRSIAGWCGPAFGPGDEAVELRFLLGFALKRADDPFYAVPAGEEQADAYFASRMERYRAWTQQYAPLVRRCLAGGRALELNFLYQDLFFGAVQQGQSEHAMLAMMAELGQALHGHAADQAAAIVGPADSGGSMQLRVNLHAAPGGALLATSARPLDLGCDLEAEVEDVRDALATLGVQTVSVARRFDAQGQPEEVVALPAQ
ncbi:hypothetical protein [Massilia sp. BJB1822]|uniref:hypothetical protein n=1 Tax=Massilia sp. BJB1822 TaxID=2744470 RepID=UPI001E30AD17|nr:hypothetical protein [Massilia sp. BJB1822]